MGHQRPVRSPEGTPRQATLFAVLPGAVVRQHLEAWAEALELNLPVQQHTEKSHNNKKKITVKEGSNHATPLWPLPQVKKRAECILALFRNRSISGKKIQWWEDKNPFQCVLWRPHFVGEMYPFLIQNLDNKSF